jgi:ATP-dependent exoDNAse (exonuclease V) alpha subunit
MKIKEHDCVVLTKNLPEEGLVAGYVGTIVHIHKNGAAYDVEFVTLVGRTVAVATVEASQLRAVGKRDIATSTARAHPVRHNPDGEGF